MNLNIDPRKVTYLSTSTMQSRPWSIPQRKFRIVFILLAYTTLSLDTKLKQ